MRGVLVLASVAVSLGFAELVVRWRIPQLPCTPMSGTAIVLYYDNPNGQMRLTPNWEGDLGGIRAKVNPNGYRDRLYESFPATATVRVAVLGDSYTMGDGVPLDETYPKQLETMFATDFNAEVLNCGISATNSIQQLATLADVLETYHPHLVVLGYNVNDFLYYKQTRFERSANAGWTHTVHPNGKVTINKRHLTPFQRVKLAVRCSSHLYRLLVSVRDWLASGRIHQRSQVQSWINAREHLRSFDAVEQMQKLCDANGVAFKVVILPALLNIPPSVRQMTDYPLTAEHEMIVDQLRSRGVQCTDLSQAFADHTLGDLVVHRLDRHYNRKGNALIATHLRQLLETDVIRIAHFLHAAEAP